MEDLPGFQTAVAYTAFLIPLLITTHQTLQIPMMQTSLIDLAKMLAVMSILGLVRAMSGPSPEAQVRGFLANRSSYSLPTD